MNKINIQTHKSPVGYLLLGSYEDKLCLLDFKYRRMRITIDKRLQAGLNAEYLEESSEVIEQTITQLKEYFEGERKTFDIPLLTIGTDFQKSVWEGLLKIPYGTTVSYLELSKNIGKEKSVASANGANAIGILTPCHRIIGSNGDLVGYAGGFLRRRSYWSWRIICLVD